MAGAIPYLIEPPGDRPQAAQLRIPDGCAEIDFSLGRRTVRLTNLRKILWPELGLTKRDLLQYYADVAPALFPHLSDRPMVVKRYPGGAGSEVFLMRRGPSQRPDWIETCAIEDASGRIVDFPVVQDLESLLWIVNLGCIDLNPWYATCDDIHRPDSLHFDLHPAAGAGFERVCQAALLIHDALAELEIDSYAKTSGSQGIQIYVPIVRGPTQQDVSRFVATLAQAMEAEHPRILTGERRVSRRPRNSVLVDYNQNIWGWTIASVYSVRPTPRATVSMPVSWDEVREGVNPEDFRLDTVPERLRRVGDLWKPMLQRLGRLRLERLTK